MLATKYEDAKREEGFTLIELLVVVIIIGILAAIAIPVFLGQQRRAQENSLQSSIQAAVTQVEVEYTEEGNYADAMTAAGFSATGAQVIDTDADGNDQVTLQFTQLGSEADGSYSYCVEGTDTRIDDAAPSYYQAMQSGAGLGSMEEGRCTDADATFANPS